MSAINETQRPHVIKDAKGKRPSFYENEGTDQLMSMVMVLASELNVLRDRVDAQERAAKTLGMDLAAAVEKLELDDDALREREAWRQDFLDRLFYIARKEASEAATGQSASSFNQIIDEIAVK